MPIIRIEYDDDKISSAEATSISKGIQKIVAEETGIEDVSVYTNAAQIKVQVAPIEIFVEMSAHKIDDIEILFKALRQSLTQWKKETDFPCGINLTIIPMQWKFETDI